MMMMMMIENITFLHHHHHQVIADDGRKGVWERERGGRGGIKGKGIKRFSPLLLLYFFSSFFSRAAAAFSTEARLMCLRRSICATLESAS